MLERLQIENFQRHQLLRVVFDPRITTITGPSDRGKSAIIRALRWVCRNRPDGRGHIRWDAEGCRVSLWVDGRVVRRVRTETDNAYYLDKQVFRAFGTEVPPDVAALLNVSDVNFQRQHDGPFWFTEKPADVSRALNTIVNLGIIDTSLTALANGNRRARLVAEVEDERRTKAKRHLEATAIVPYIDDALADVEERAEVVIALDGRIAALGTAITECRYHKDAQERAALYTDHLNRVVEAGKWAKRKQERVDALQGVCRRVREATAALRPVPDARPLAAAYKRATEAGAGAEKLAGLVAAIRAARGRVKERQAALRIANDNLQEYTGGVCPTCNRPLR